MQFVLLAGYNHEPFPVNAIQPRKFCPSNILYYTVLTFYSTIPVHSTVPVHHSIPLNPDAPSIVLVNGHHFTNDIPYLQLLLPAMFHGQTLYCLGLTNAIRYLPAPHQVILRLRQNGTL